MKLIFVVLLTLMTSAQALKNLRIVYPKISGQSSKILKGSPAPPHSFPYQVALIISYNQLCGGLLIRSNVILTTAHCVVGAEHIEAVAGVHNLLKYRDSHQNRVIKNVTIHQDWDSRTFKNNIALLTVLKPFILNEHVRLIGIYKGGCPDSSLNSKTAILSGWGKSRQIAVNANANLRYIRNRIMSNEECKSYFNYIEDTSLCLNDNDDDRPCHGDGGGPLVTMINNVSKAIGILSMVSCWGCQLGLPSIYTRLSCYYDWIQNELCPL